MDAGETLDGAVSRYRLHPGAFVPAEPGGAPMPALPRVPAGRRAAA